VSDCKLINASIEIDVTSWADLWAFIDDTGPNFAPNGSVFSLVRSVWDDGGSSYWRWRRAVTSGMRYMIRGNGVTIGGLTLRAGASVALENVTSSFSHALVLTDSMARVTDSRFHGRLSAMSFNRSTVTFLRVQFSEMSPVSHSEMSSAGGAVHLAAGSNATIEHCYFINCMCLTGQGGAIALLGGSTAAISLSTFSANNFLWTNGNLGGAIYVENSRVSVDASIFEGNYVACNHCQGFQDSPAGGAIFLANSQAMIRSSNFTSNHAGGSGSAIAATKSNLTIDGTHFSANHFGNAGSEWQSTLVGNGNAGPSGVISMYESSSQITDSIFEKNIGVCIIVANSNVTIASSQFSNNKGSLYFGGYVDFDVSAPAGAICISYGSIATIEFCCFESNIGGSYQGGGAISIVGRNSHTTIRACNFTSNSAIGGAYSSAGMMKYSGGGAVQIAAPCAIFSCNFSHNNAIADYDPYSDTIHGGAILIRSSNSDYFESSVSHCSFSSNSAKYGGGIAVIAVTVAISNSSFISNHADHSGGALFTTARGSHCHWLISHSVLTRNTANYSGGGVSMYAANTTFKNTIFSGNVVQRSVLRCDSCGGKLASEGCGNCCFPGPPNCGAICVKCYGNGGAIAMTAGSRAVMFNSTLHLNYAANYAGAVFMDGSSTLECHQCQIFENGSPLSSEDNVFGPPVRYFCDKHFKFGTASRPVCTECKKGQVADQQQSSCQDCPLGKFERASFCEHCPPGQFQNETGQTQCNTCDVCKVGAREACNGPSAGYCPNVCLPGHFLRRSSTRQFTATCIVCPAAKYQAQQGKYICISCETGKYSSKEGAMMCLNCPAGKHERNNTCADCLSGQFQNEPGSGTHDIGPNKPPLIRPRGHGMACIWDGGWYRWGGPIRVLFIGTGR
jgi:hypothetical protein